jgi:hypothetical protein
MNRNYIIVPVVGALAAGAAALLWSFTAPNTGPAVQDARPTSPEPAASPPTPPMKAQRQPKVEDIPPPILNTTRRPVLMNGLPVITHAEDIHFANNALDHFIGEEERPVFPTDARGIKDAVRMGEADLKACYDTFLATSPDLAGRLVMEFTIDNDEGDLARTTNVVVGSNSNVDHIWLEGCIATVFEEFRFDLREQEGPINVAYPLNFSP